MNRQKAIMPTERENSYRKRRPSPGQPQPCARVSLVLEPQATGGAGAAGDGRRPVLNAAFAGMVAIAASDRFI